MRNRIFSAALQRPVAFCSIAIAFFAMGTAPVASAAEGFSPRFSQVGQFGVVAGGVGMEADHRGDILLDVPGAPVAAFLYWVAQDDSSGGDDAVTLWLNGGRPVPVAADESFGPKHWYSSHYRHLSPRLLCGCDGGCDLRRELLRHH